MKTALMLLFVVSLSYSEDTVLHGVQGFTLHYAVAKGFGADKTTCTVAGITGLLFGILPDMPYRGYRVHTFSNEFGAVNAIPGFSLHLGLDIPYHDGKFGPQWGKDWRLVGLDVVLWIATIWILEKLTDWRLL